MTRRPGALPVPTGQVALFVLGVALLVAGQVMSWGFAPIDVSVPFWFRIAFVVAPLVLLAREALLWNESSRPGRLATAAVAVPVALVSLAAAGWAFVEFRDYLQPKWGGLLLIASQVVFAVTAVLTVLPARRFVSETVGAVLVVLTVVLGLTWWPAVSESSATASEVRGSVTVGRHVSAVVDTGRYGFAGVFGGRPVLIRNHGCERDVQGLDPADGSVAWHYSRRTCAGTVGVTGNDHIVQLRYTVYAGGQPNEFVYLDPSTGRRLHPDSLSDSITDWVGDVGLVFTANPDASVAGGNIVAVVDPLSGRLRGTDVLDACPDGYSQRLAVADGVFARVAVSGSRLALPYACVDTSGSAPHQVQQHLLILDLGGGARQDVRLPDSAADDVDVPTTRNDDDPVYPLVVAANDTFVVGYQTDRASGSVRQLVGVDGSGKTLWNTTRSVKESLGSPATFHPVGDAAVLTATGFFAARSGDFRPYDAAGSAPGANGVTVGDRYVSPGTLNGDTVMLTATGVNGTAEDITVRSGGLRGVKDERSAGGLFLYAVAGGLCLVGADSIALLT